MSQERDFGLLISILLPGFIVILGVAHHSPIVRHWIGNSLPDSPSLGGFLYLTVAAIFAGMVMSTVRWLMIDKLHHATGLKQPSWNFARLADRQQSFSMLVEVHYRYYQFYGNSMMAILVFVVSRWSAIGFSLWEILIATFLEIVFWLGSRDTLRKYYQRADALLDTNWTG